MILSLLVVANGVLTMAEKAVASATNKLRKRSFPDRVAKNSFGSGFLQTKIGTKKNTIWQLFI